MHNTEKELDTNVIEKVNTFLKKINSYQKTIIILVISLIAALISIYDIFAKIWYILIQILNNSPINLLPLIIVLFFINLIILFFSVLGFISRIYILVANNENNPIKKNTYYQIAYSFGLRNKTFNKIKKYYIDLQK
ncbi:hypothetical protein [Mycoplasma sp. 1018B]|uniref:hypothetical protein n=1 Tax=Mycoplasma sp. 1018B TaxID=2967302 RepID=UPI00211C4D93|nr:hypothetical protein [Mycoplasma sp. 1018B]UUM19395.1 hypothetical protein NPA14_00780 [Mycoplasma sp. 1018B]